MNYIVTFFMVTMQGGSYFHNKINKVKIRSGISCDAIFLTYAFKASSRSREYNNRIRKRLIYLPSATASLTAHPATIASTDMKSVKEPAAKQKAIDHICTSLVTLMNIKPSKCSLQSTPGSLTA